MACLIEKDLVLIVVRSLYIYRWHCYKYECEGGKGIQFVRQTIVVHVSLFNLNSSVCCFTRLELED